MKMPSRLAYDRGGRGPKEVRGVQVITPGKPSKKDSAYQRRKKRWPFRRRAGTEPLIGHLKYDQRMLENYLWGKALGTVNAMLAATAWNLKKLMKELIFVLMRIIVGNRARKTIHYKGYLLRSD